MKKCDHIKDLILTDYMDGELDQDLKHNVESHLLDCSDCRTFLKEVKENSIIPFNKDTQLPVPPQLWDAVKEGIAKQGHASDPIADFIDRIKEMIVFPKLVPVFATLMLMLFVGSVTLNNMQFQQAQATEQGEYLVSLLSITNPAQVENNDLGTPIEHFFL